MTFKERLPYFLGGLLIGIIIVIFVFGKKKTNFDYGPNARVLKNIRTKERVFSPKALESIRTYNIDTAQISVVLKEGNADMWNKVKKGDCTEYKINHEKLSLVVLNCETTATIEEVIVSQQ